MTRSLCDLKPGDRGTIATVDGPRELGKRLTALGIFAGRPLHLVRRAWLRGPLHIRLGTTDVALRRSEAAAILVRLAAPDAA